MIPPQERRPTRGARFCWLGDVPNGWTYRRDQNGPWELRDDRYWRGSREIVEARPHVDLVAVHLPLEYVEWLANGQPYASGIGPDVELHVSEICGATLRKLKEGEKR